MGRHCLQCAGNALHTKRMAGRLRSGGQRRQCWVVYQCGGFKHLSSGWTSGRMVGRHGRVA